jgi:general secretion pathway protein D
MNSGSSETGLGGSSAQITKISTIEDTLKEIVPWPADSKLVYDKRINALLIRNTPQNLQMLEDLLYNLDVTPCQVLIEARFLEVDVTDIRELGLEWKLAGGDFALKERDGVYKKGIAKDSGLDFSSFTRATEGLNLTYKGMLTNSQLQVVLHALDETKKLKTLSSPRITTLNNQMASIKVVDEWIYPTRYEFEIVQFDLNGDGDYSDANETVYQNVPKDFLRRDVGILLKVIPSVGADRKTINLSLIPEVSEATADAFVYTGDVKLPKFTSRNLSTTVVANSGDTVVLGGMIKESRTKTVTKVPFLGDIPLLGAFFKKDADSIQRKNLLIFVTAKILSPSGEEIIVAQK